MTGRISAFSIIALNIRAGGGKNIPTLTDYLDSYDCQVVMLSEWHNSSRGREVEGWAKTRGMYYTGQADGGKANGVFIASKLPFTTKTHTPENTDAGVLMMAEFENFNVLACYFPGMAKKAPFFARCADLAVANESVPLMIVGDLNTGNQIGDRSEKASRYLCADAFHGLTSRQSLHDLWRRTHGPDAREWTLLSRTKNGFRIDHAFANATFIQRTNPTCVYDHRPREMGWTDHSAVIVRGEG